jgi:hypothetical protein
MDAEEKMLKLLELTDSGKLKWREWAVDRPFPVGITEDSTREVIRMFEAPMQNRRIVVWRETGITEHPEFDYNYIGIQRTRLAFVKSDQNSLLSMIDGADLAGRLYDLVASMVDKDDEWWGKLDD